MKKVAKDVQPSRTEKNSTCKPGDAFSEWMVTR